MSNGTTAQAIEVTYGGFLLKSHLEARWARFFDALGTPWEYEPRTFRLKGQRWQYTPDFYLPEKRIYVEVKPCAVSRELFDKYTAYAPYIVSGDDCDLFLLVIREPRYDIVYGALSANGNVRYSFAEDFGHETARGAAIVAQSMRVP